MLVLVHKTEEKRPSETILQIQHHLVQKLDETIVRTDEKQRPVFLMNIHTSLLNKSLETKVNTTLKKKRCTL